MVEMVPLSRAHALEETETTKMNRLLHGIARRGLRLDITQSLFGATNWVVFEGFQLLCLVFTVGMFLYGSITKVGDIKLYQDYFSMLVTSVTMILAMIPTFVRGIEAVTSVGELMHAEEEESGEGKVALTDVEGAFHFEGVNFDYEENHPVLSDFCLDVKPGETVALVGESGVGKTTVINMVILRSAGATEVHLRSSSPPFVNPCYYGTDIDSRDNLIACHHTVDEIVNIVGADSLGFLPLDRVAEVAEGSRCGGYCTACFDGVYPTEIPPKYINKFDNKISESEN